MRFLIALFMGFLASMAMLGVHMLFGVNLVDQWVFMLIGFVAGFLGSSLSKQGS